MSKKPKLKLSSRELWGDFAKKKKKEKIEEPPAPRTALELTKMLRASESLGEITFSTSRISGKGLRPQAIVRNPEGLELLLPVGSIIFKNTDPSDLRREEGKLVLEFGGSKAEISIEMVRTVKKPEERRRPSVHAPKVAGLRRP